MVWALRQLAFWLIGGLAIYLVVANSGLLTMHRDDGVNPAATAAVVDRASSPLANSLILYAGHDGHVLVDAAVNGTPLHMAFDTGATFVALTQADAARIGIAGGLDYTIPFVTGNGRAYGALVTLRAIRIGQLEIDDVKAVVMPNLEFSLLGQSFLSRLSSYEMRGGALTLTW